MNNAHKDETTLATLPAPYWIEISSKNRKGLILEKHMDNVILDLMATGDVSSRLFSVYYSIDVRVMKMLSMLLEILGGWSEFWVPVGPVI